MTASTVTLDITDRSLVVRGVAIPILDDDPGAVFNVRAEDGVITAIDRVRAGSRQDNTVELWPGYVETHGHVALPANFDDSLDDPRIVAQQYLYHGVTHVVDMFGFPLVKNIWEEGSTGADVPYPEIVHCGYAATSMRDRAGRSGHGVEFPAPVYMLGVGDDAETVLEANRARGATFLKVMYTNGTEQPGSAVRFSRLNSQVLADAARVANGHGIPAVIDCNTRDEVFDAYACGYRLFAHSVRDVDLSDEDWVALNGARFGSTLAGLRPMIMERDEFLAEYNRPGFKETNDISNLEFVSDIEVPFGIQYGLQDTRTAALTSMRNNAIAALRRKVLLIGTDSGNTGAFHGYSLLRELDLLADGDTELFRELRMVATVQGWRYFEELSGRSAVEHPIQVGRPATFNLLEPVGKPGALSALPMTTVINGTLIDRQAIEDSIKEIRANQWNGKVVL